MSCTYFTALILLVLHLSGAMKRNFNPDLFMQILMFKDKTMPEQSPSVFEAKWGFSIHDPGQYQNQYGARKVFSNRFNKFGQDYKQVLGARNLKTHSHQMYQRPHVNKATNQNIDLHKALDFNKDSHDMLNNYKLTKHHPETGGQTEKGPSSEIETDIAQEIFGNNTTNNKIDSKETSGIPRVKSKNKYSSRLSNSFHFDPTDLNSKMFNSEAYNPTYVNSLTRSSARHKRSTTEFDPNAMMNKYMELRTNIDSFGSYHPNDMISTILLLFKRNKKNSNGENFDPNGNSMLSSTQHWGFSVYNPLQSLEQYNGKNIGRGSSGPNPNTVHSGFNPNALNNHLMATLSQHDGKHSTQSYGNTGFNSNNLNNKLFEGLSFNPATVNMKTIHPIVQETIPMALLTSLQNRTSDHELPGFAYLQGHEQKASSAGSENGYVKNTHSKGNIVPNENSGELQKENSHKIGGHAPNTHLILDENSNNGQGNVNSGEKLLQTPKPNISDGRGNLYGEQGKSMIQNNAAYHVGSEKVRGHTPVTGHGSLAGHIQTNGNGYQQSIYQQGPTQGMINDTSILNGSGGTITQPQTQAGGLGSTVIHQNMLLSGNGQSTNFVAGKISNNSRSSGNELGSTMVQQFAGSDLGSQGGKTQANQSMANYTAIQTASENTGTSVLPQTGAGGPGYPSASQSVTGVSNSGEQIDGGGIEGNTAFHGVDGGFGSTSISQTAAGSLGPSSGSENATSWLNYGATGGTEFIGVGQTGSGSNLNSVTQTSNGKLGPNTAHQSGAGSLGSNVEAQEGLGEYIISQTEPGGLGSSTFGQSDSGSLGSNYVLQTSKEMESNKESQTPNGKIGTSKTVQSDIDFS